MRFHTALFLFMAVSAFGAELRLTLHDEPKTVDPWLTADESAETLQYLTEGVLIRVNRLTQQPEAELAVSWSVSKDATKSFFSSERACASPTARPSRRKT